jgi:predicted dehydrogenase
MRFLIVGLGSMGKRRVRNLRYLKVDDIAGFDPRGDRRDEAASKYGISTFENFDNALASFRPDALIISTPPDLHVRYAKLAISNKCHFFSEASVVDDEMDELINVARQRPELVAAPSCTMRFHPSIQAIKQIVHDGQFGKPLLLPVVT